MEPSRLTLAVTLGLLAIPSAHSESASSFQPQLAVTYQEEVITDWGAYFYSEKLDGIRAYWSGKHLSTRHGTRIHAPDWFVAALPEVPLEGELWIGRNQFEQTMATVMDDVPDEDAWQTVKLMVFDMPASLDSFEQRYQKIQHLVAALNLPYLGYVKHYPVDNETQLERVLKAVNQAGGEGLMLRKRLGLYQAGRSSNVVKMKVADDAEAEVIGHLPGKGKHEGRLGALVVKMPNGVQFRVGTGFSDAQREDPPAIGSHITYRYNGFTKNGIPKFARFMRVDHSKQ